MTTERNTEIAAPAPRFPYANDSIYMVRANVSEVRYGPPFVMTQILSKTLKLLTKAINNTTKMVGLIIGKITLM